MGKVTGFMEIARQTGTQRPPEERIRDFNEFHLPLPLEEQQAQGARCMDCGVPFCQSGMMIGGMASGCPLHNLIPEWNDLVYQGRWELALQRLMATNRFPEFTSRVCPALCEAACTCGMAAGAPVSVRENERAIIEYGYASGAMRPVPPPVRTGKKVAVVGAGPAGLAAADLLNRRGHTVTVYDREDRPGGLLMYGIPNMKLDKSVIERRIALMEAEGIRFVLGADVGGSLPAREVLESADAVVLCCGAKQPRDLPAPGREAAGIHFAVDYLTSVTRSLLDSRFADGRAISAAGKQVLVVGGGDTGNDCVGTCIRHGAKSVVQLEMMPKLPDTRAASNPWPEWPKVCKTDYGQEEAIAVFGHDPRIYQTTVKELVRDDEGRLTGLKTVRLSFEHGSPEEIEGSEAFLECDLLLIAAGFTGCTDDIAQAFNLELTSRHTAASEPGSYKTNVEKVFTAGDMHRGQSLVVWAIAEGRACAKEVDEYLMGYTNME